MVNFKDRDILDDTGDEYTVLGWTKKVGQGKSSKLYTMKGKYQRMAGAAYTEKVS